MLAQILKLKKKNYLEWEELNRIIIDSENIRFIDQTARISLNNYWKKRCLE